MSTKIAIQINSLEALEKLMWDSNWEITLELKQAVVQEFVKKHLKAVANEDIVRKAEIATKEWIEQNYFDKVKGQWGRETLVFKESTMTTMKEILKRIWNASVWHWVEEIVWIKVMKERVDAALNNATTVITTALTDAHLEYRLKQMVDKKLQQLSDLASKLK